MNRSYTSRQFITVLGHTNLSPCLFRTKAHTFDPDSCRTTPCGQGAPPTSITEPENMISCSAYARFTLELSLFHRDLAGRRRIRPVRLLSPVYPFASR